MKRKLLTSLVLLASILVSTSQAQGTYELPTKDGKLFFTNVVTVDSTFKKNDLYSKARQWFVNYYKSADDVLQMDDKEEGKLIGKGLHKYNFFNGLDASEVNLFFTVNITVKDGKYKYEIYNFNGKRIKQSALAALSSNPSQTSTEVIDFDHEYNELLNKTGRIKYRTKVVEGLKKEVLAIILSLEKAMKAANDSDF